MRELVDFLDSIEYMHLVPQLVKNPARFRVELRDPLGSDLLYRLAGLSKTSRDARLKRIVEALKIALPSLNNLEFENGSGTPHLIARIGQWRGGGDAKQDERSMSDGTLRLLGILWTIMMSKGPLLLEEPELSLHASVARQIPAMIARMQGASGRQVLVTTHSETLLSDPGIGAAEIHLLNIGKQGSVVETGANMPGVMREMDAGLSAGEVAMAHTSVKGAELLAQLKLFD